MGKQKYQTRIMGLFDKSPIVHFSSINRIIGDKKKVKQYSKQLVRNLLIKGKIQRLTKGYYTKHQDPYLSVFCFTGYLGLQNSLSYHNLWEQETIPIIITTQKVRPGIRKVLGTNILIRRIDKKYFFGFEYKKYDAYYVPISDIEKTYIDMVYFREPMGREVLQNLKKNINKKKLDAYLKKYPKKFREKILS